MDQKTLYIDEIINYAQQGNAIFPCRAYNKSPLLPQPDGERRQRQT